MLSNKNADCQVLTVCKVAHFAIAQAALLICRCSQGYELSLGIQNNWELANAKCFDILIHLIQNRISYCMSTTSLVITLTEQQINVLIIFQGKPHYCCRQFSKHLGDS